MGRKSVIAGAAIFALAFLGGGAFAANRFVITNIRQIKPSGPTAVAQTGLRKPLISRQSAQILPRSRVRGRETGSEVLQVKKR